jgi:hypothetical protein
MITICSVGAAGVNVSNIYRPLLMSCADVSGLFGNENVEFIESQFGEDILQKMLGGNSGFILCKVSGDLTTGKGIYDEDILIREGESIDVRLLLLRSMASFS